MSDTAEMTETERQISLLNLRVRSLERLVECLCVTNFLIESGTVDEDMRSKAIDWVNRHAKKASDKWVAELQHNDLWNKKREIEEQMNLIQQDFPHLKAMNT